MLYVKDTYFFLISLSGAGYPIAYVHNELQIVKDRSLNEYSLS
jgi:hypothetical protein